MNVRGKACVAIALAFGTHGALAACGEVLSSAPGDDAGSMAEAGSSNDTGPDGGSGGALDAATRGDCGDEAGSVMVRIGASCIDSTEVTIGDYRQFMVATLDGSVDAVAPLPAACSSQDTFVPQAGWPRQTFDDPLAVTEVDWCDAWAYCRFVGKRLCTSAEWLDVCSGGGARSYAYGDTFVEERCLIGKPRLTDFNPWPVERVANRPECRDPNLPIYDLGGNAQEWTSDCVDETPDAACEVRAPGSSAPIDQATCASTYRIARDGAGTMVGFRCCLP